MYIGSGVSKLTAASALVMETPVRRSLPLKFAVDIDIPNSFLDVHAIPNLQQ